MIKITYDENFKMTGIGRQEYFVSDEPYILMDLTDEEYETLLNAPFKRLMIDVEYNTVISTLTLEEPIDEVSDIERLKKENNELKERLVKIESILGI